MFDNYPPGTSPSTGLGVQNPLNGGTPNGAAPVVDMYASLPASPSPSASLRTEAPLGAGVNAAQQAMPNQNPITPQYNNITAGFNPDAAEVGGTGSLKFLVIGLVTLVLVLVGAFVVYQMVLKPKFEGAVLTPVVPEVSNLTETAEEIMNDIAESNNVASSSVETQIIYSPATSSEAMSSSSEAMATSSVEAVAQPVEKDSDSDGLSDDLETLKGTNKLMPDTDADGLSDAEEAVTHNTNPLLADSDADGLNDGEEVLKYKTKPLVLDTDGDTFSDGQEVKNNYNPLGSGRLIVTK